MNQPVDASKKPASPMTASGLHPYDPPRLTSKHQLDQLTLSIAGGRPIPGGPGQIGNP